MEAELIEGKAKNLYDIVSEAVYKFCDDTYYHTCIVKFEQSYDGKEWTEETEIVFFENGTDLVFDTDWCEGQNFIRNIRICHLDEVLLPDEKNGGKRMREFEKIVRYTQRGESDMYDVTEVGDVVRCKDCNLFYPEHEGGIGSCGLDMNVTANDYCSKAERKDDTQNG